LQLVLDRSTSTPRAVELLATRELCAGDALRFSYGPRPLRSWVGAYGFLPESTDRESELFEEVNLAASTEALLIQCDGPGLLRLAELRMGNRLVYVAKRDSRTCHHPAVCALETGALKQLSSLQPELEALISGRLAEAAEAAAHAMDACEQLEQAQAQKADACPTAGPPCASLSAEYRKRRNALLRRAADELRASSWLLLTSSS
jgi:hypothetical protein